MADKAKQVILHCGLAKTGTSALQRAMFEKRQVLLRKYKTLYPGGNPHHHNLLGVFATQPEAWTQIQLQGFSTQSEMDAFYRRYQEKILKEINRTKPERIIFSSEYFAEMSPEELLRLRGFLESIGEEIIPFVYVRDPWSWSVSLRQEEIHRGGRKKETSFNYTIPLRARLEKLEAAFGRQMTVAPYLPGAGKFDVVADFFHRFGLDGLIPVPDEKIWVRTSMNLEAAALMLQVNQLYPVFDENKAFIPDPARSLMSKTIQNSPLSRTPLQISRKTARKIYKESKADLEYVEDKYFDGKRLFTDFYRSTKFPEFDDTISLSAFSQEELGEYLLSCLYSLSQDFVDKTEINQSTREQLSEKIKLVQLLKMQIEENEQRMEGLYEQISTQEKSLQGLTGQLSAREQTLQEITSEVSTIKSSQGWKSVLTIRRLLNTYPRFRHRLHAGQDLALITASKLFDPQWYLEHSPDAAAEKVIDPARHYLLYGGFEGLDPGKEFDSDWYLKEYPDIRRRGINPLVHYLRFGKKEGRGIAGEKPAPAPPPQEKVIVVPQTKITREILRLSADKQEKLANMRPPVFVFGPPRSGSTFLVEAMNRHESIFITNELRVMSFINDIFQLVIKSNRKEWNLRGKYKDEFLTLFRDESANMVKRFYQRKMEGLKVIWGDKHPHYADRGTDPGALATICELFPNARFIHIYRHPRQVINSLTAKKWWNFNAAVDLYKSIFLEGRKLGNEIGSERYLEIKYEYLVDHGREAVEQICDFLNIPVSERWLNYMEQQERLRTPYCDPVTEQELIGKSTVESFTEEQELYLKQELGKIMEDLGYL
jgi:hypothetical protein